MDHSLQEDCPIRTSTVGRRPRRDRLCCLETPFGGRNVVARHGRIAAPAVGTWRRRRRLDVSLGRGVPAIARKTAALGPELGGAILPQRRSDRRRPTWPVRCEYQHLGGPRAAKEDPALSDDTTLAGSHRERNRVQRVAGGVDCAREAGGRHRVHDSPRGGDPDRELSVAARNEAWRHGKRHRRRLRCGRRAHEEQGRHHQRGSSTPAPPHTGRIPAGKPPSQVPICGGSSRRRAMRGHCIAAESRQESICRNTSSRSQSSAIRIVPSSCLKNRRRSNVNSTDTTPATGLPWLVFQMLFTVASPCSLWFRLDVRRGTDGYVARCCWSPTPSCRPAGRHRLPAAGAPTGGLRR